MLKKMAVCLLLSGPLMAVDYVDNGDGTVTKTEQVVETIKPQAITDQITALRARKDVFDKRFQAQIDALTGQLNDIYAKVPEVKPVSVAPADASVP